MPSRSPKRRHKGLEIGALEAAGLERFHRLRYLLVEGEKFVCAHLALGERERQLGAEGAFDW